MRGNDAPFFEFADRIQAKQNAEAAWVWNLKVLAF